jgi:hypothetical protein
MRFRGRCVRLISAKGDIMYKVRLCIGLGVILSFLLCQAFMYQDASKKAPRLVEQIDHILLVPDNPRALFDFFTQELMLPVAWPYREYGSFASGGVFAGNMNLEAAVFSGSSAKSQTKIVGIAFEPSGTTEEVVKELDRRQIGHLEPQPFEMGPAGNKMKLWTNTILEDMLPGSFIFICEYHIYKIYNTEPSALRNQLKEALNKIDGGPLGIEYVSEVKINVKERAKLLERWKNFLEPYECFQDGCFNLGKGPKIRFLEADANCIDSLRIKVKSLDKAYDFLCSREMIGIKNDQGIITDPNRTFGILFEFVEFD